MGIRKAKKVVETKKRAYAAAGSSVAMEEMPPHGPGGASHVQAPPPLPPGVYFSPTREECLGFLNRWIAGDSEMADARGYIFGANVYGESPDALCRTHPPASVRGRGEHAWWFLSQTRFQSQTAGGGVSKRADRRVETGGYWRLEQSRERLEQGKEGPKKQSKEQQQPEQGGEEQLEEAEGVKNSFGFYVGAANNKEHKTPWLMQEFTSANDDGAGKRGVPALYRVYVTPRATQQQLEDVFGEDGVKKGADGKKKPARAVVSQRCFDAIAQLLPEGSVRAGVVQEQQQALPPPPPPPPVGLLGYHGQQGQYVDRYHHHHHHQQQQDEGQYLVPYQQQEWQENLGPYHQQQGPFSGVLPPEPRRILGEIPSSDNLSMPMDEFMKVINGPPAEMVNDSQPAEMANDSRPAVTVKGGEPNWESLDDIVDADELANFNKEG